MTTRSMTVTFMPKIAFHSFVAARVTLFHKLIFFQDYTQDLEIFPIYR